MRPVTSIEFLMAAANVEQSINFENFRVFLERADPSLLTT